MEIYVFKDTRATGRRNMKWSGITWCCTVTAIRGNIARGSHLHEIFTTGDGSCVEWRRVEMPGVQYVTVRRSSPEIISSRRRTRHHFNHLAPLRSVQFGRRQLHLWLGLDWTRQTLPFVGILYDTVCDHKLTSSRLILVVVVVVVLVVVEMSII